MTLITMSGMRLPRGGRGRYVNRRVFGFVWFGSMTTQRDGDGGLEGCFKSQDGMMVFVVVKMELWNFVSVLLFFSCT